MPKVNKKLLLLKYLYEVRREFTYNEYILKMAWPLDVKYKWVAKSPEYRAWVRRKDKITGWGFTRYWENGKIKELR